MTCDALRDLVWNAEKRHTIKPWTPEHRTTEHGTLAEYRNSGVTLTEQRNTGGTIGISQKNGTREHRQSKGTIRSTTNTEQRNIEQIT